MPQQEGLPSVKYFADKVFLSSNYFGDMIRKQTGKTASEYIQTKVIERAKENLHSSDKTMSEIAYDLGFQYPQHLSRMFKRVAGCTPNEFRAQNWSKKWVSRKYKAGTHRVVLPTTNLLSPLFHNHYIKYNRSLDDHFRIKNYNHAIKILLKRYLI